MDYKNFFVPQGNLPVKIDQILTPGETYNFDISLKGDTMRAANPDSAIDKLDLEQIAIGFGDNLNGNKPTDCEATLIKLFFH